MKFAVYNTTSGEITKRGDASPSQVMLQVTDGEEVFLNCPDDATHIIDGTPQVIVEPPPVPSMDEMQARLTAAVQIHLDTTARQRNYDHILSACSYATSTNDRFRAEGQACVEWRDAVWAKCYQVVDDVHSGARGIPTAEELIAELPPMVWPS